MRLGGSYFFIFTVGVSEGREVVLQHLLDGETNCIIEFVGVNKRTWLLGFRAVLVLRFVFF